MTAVPVDMVCDDLSFIREKQDALFNINTRSCFYGTPEYNTDIQEASNLSVVVQKTDAGVMTVPSSGYGFSLMKVPCKYIYIFFFSGLFTKINYSHEGSYFGLW